jgi:hypothetical protein
MKNAPGGMNTAQVMLWITRIELISWRTAAHASAEIHPAPFLTNPTNSTKMPVSPKNGVPKSPPAHKAKPNVIKKAKKQLR